jgi:hypothetical protein
MDGLAIPEEQRGPRRGWQARLSASLATASLAGSLSFWLMLALPRWRWLDSIAGWQLVRIEAFALLLAMAATFFGVFFGAKLWRIALPVAFLTFLLTYYTMVS